MVNTSHLVFLNDLLDDLDHKQLTELLNYLAVNSYVASRGNIKGWRRFKGLPWLDTELKPAPHGSRRHLTDNEIAVFKGVDASEYGEFMNAGCWTFSVLEHSKIVPRSLPGILSSLVKKGYITVGGSGVRGDEHFLYVTRAGFDAYVEAVGQENVKKYFDYDSYKLDNPDPKVQ